MFEFEKYPEALWAFDIGADRLLDTHVRAALDVRYPSATYCYRWVALSAARDVKEFAQEFGLKPVERRTRSKNQPRRSIARPAKPVQQLLEELRGSTCRCLNGDEQC